MPSMKRDSTLRLEPAGALMQVIATEGSQVDVLGTVNTGSDSLLQEWVKVKLVNDDDGAEGWVLSDRVNLSGIVPGGPIDQIKFIRQCWLESLIADVVPHYVVAFAQMRSSLSTGEQNGEIGPFRFLQTEWDAYCSDPQLGFADFKSCDIYDWRAQCVVFCGVTFELEIILRDMLLSAPSIVDLFLAQIVGATAAEVLIRTPGVLVRDALCNLDVRDLPTGGLTCDQISKRIAKILGLDDQRISGQLARDTIGAAMQPILDATRQIVGDVGSEYLGLIPHDGVIDNAVDAGPDKPDSPKKAPSIPTDDGPAIVPGAGGLLGELIAKHEGGAAGYGAFNRGIAGVGGKIDFSKLTIEQVMALQRLPDKSQRLFAVGKYQMIPLTMRDCVSKLNINPKKTLFGPAIQEFMFRNYLIAIKRPAVKNYITGGGASLRQAQMALAFEFASVARPDTGRSNYGGVGGNKASISADQIKAALEGEFTRFRQIIAHGASSDDAWSALSPGFV